MIEKRQLGRTGIAITPIGLGVWQFSQRANIAGSFWPVLSEETMLDIVRRTLDGGITFFDTAEAYGNGASERALAASLQALGVAPGEVVIATKWAPWGRFADSIKRTIGDRIANLHPYPIDLHQVHFPSSFSGTTSQMNAMADLLDTGLVKSVGVSNFGPAVMEKAFVELKKRGYDLASNQVKYSLLDRHIEDDGTLAKAKELGVTIIAYSPLEQGLLTGKFHADPSLIKKAPGPRKLMPAFQPKALEKTQPLIDELKAIAAGYGVTAEQVALNWLITFHGDAVVAIPGASKPHHAEANAGALKFTLTACELGRIDELSRQVAGK